MSTRAAVVTLISLAIAAGLCAQTVDHTYIDGVSALPQSVMDAIGEQRWFFSHASVGGNMVQGMSTLHSSNPTRYQLATSSVGYNSGELRANDPPSPTTPGTLYECQRGNPGWSSKYTIFDNSVRVSGWHYDAVDFAMDKLCYIDQNADSSVYITMMTALEADYPSTIFVYITMPLTESSDSSNVLRNEYNDAVRSFCAANGKLLFDLADMEAFHADGSPCTFEYSTQTYQLMCDEYSDDGGHLNTVGRERIAVGWYATAAITEQDVIFIDGFESNDLSRWSTSSGE